MIRIGSATLAQLGISSMLEQQALVARAQQQITSGHKDASAADNPADFAAAMGYDEALEQLERYGKNADIVSNRLGLEDNALSTVNDTLQRIRDLAVQANNATQDDTSRAAIVTELEQRYQELVDAANSGDGQGRYLFAGGNDSTPPFSITGSGVNYGGDAGSRRIAINAGTQIADGDNGNAVFMSITTGNGAFAARGAAGNTGAAILSQASLVDGTQWDSGSYSIKFTSATSYEVRDGANTLVTSGSYASGQAISFRGVSVTLEGKPAAGDSFSVAPGSQTDMFGVVQDLIDTLSAPFSNAAGEASRHNAVYASLEDLDRSLDHVVSLRAGVGARMTQAQDAKIAQESLSGQLENARSGVRDTDPVKAASALQLHLVALQAAQQAFLKIQGLSLFNYIR